MRIPWFHNRRQEILCEPFPDEWRPWLEKNLLHYSLLTPEERTRLEGDLRIFREEKFWEGASGTDVTDEMKVTVSAHACLLTLGFEEHDYYPNVRSIIVYAGGYRAPSSGVTVGGIYEQTAQDRLGEAHADGPVILSWSDTVYGSRNGVDGVNLALHEFAHKLDFRSGAADGVPRLETQEQYDRWAEVMSAEYAQLVDDVEHHRHSLLQSYGATNAAEFFAVSTEAFFEKPVKMREDHPELYDVLLSYYKQDWAERMRSSQ